MYRYNPLSQAYLFIAVLFLSIFRPETIWEDWPVSMELITVVVVFSLLFKRVFFDIGLREFWKRYKAVSILVTVYHLLCITSVFANAQGAAEADEIIRFGLTGVAVTGTFAALFFLFNCDVRANQADENRLKRSTLVLLPWFFVFLLCGLRIWQHLDPSTANYISQFFISIGYNKAGFFRISTDLGAVLGICIASLVLVFLSDNFSLLPRRSKVLLILLAALIFYAAAINGARVFLLQVMVMSGLLLYHFFWRKRSLFLLSVIFAFLLFHLFIMVSPERTALKLSSMLPYLISLRTGGTITFSELIPNISLVAFGDRLPLWETAAQLIQQNPWLGPSNGVARLASPNEENNTHNLFLQVLVDAGLLGGIVVLLLCAFLFRRLYMSGTKMLQLLPIFSMLACLMVDFYPDHSLPWVICASYFISVSLRSTVAERFQQSKVINARTYRVQLAMLMLGCCVTVAFLLGMYHENVARKNAQLTSQRTEMVENL